MEKSEVPQPDKCQLSEDALAAAIEGGLNYSDYAASMLTNKKRMRTNYEALAPSSEASKDLALPPAPLRILALVEDWCPDVLANLPIIARIAEANPHIELVVLKRSHHLEVASVYPGPTIAESKVPTYVVLDVAGRQLGVLVERPETIDKVMMPYGEKIAIERATRFPGLDRQDLPIDYIKEITAGAQALRVKHLFEERDAIHAWLAGLQRP